VSSGGASDRFGSEARVMRSIRSCFDQGSFPLLSMVVVLFAWWRSSSSSLAGLCQCDQLLCAAAVFGYVFRADASALWFVSSGTCCAIFSHIVVVVPWQLRWSVPRGAAMQQSCTVLQNAPSPIVLHRGGGDQNSASQKGNHMCTTSIK
jgi:hypothetical protein